MWPILCRQICTGCNAAKEGWEWYVSVCFLQDKMQPYHMLRKVHQMLSSSRHKRQIHAQGQWYGSGLSTRHSAGNAKITHRVLSSRVGRISDIVGSVVLKKHQRISVWSEPNNVDVLEQNIIPQQQRIEYTQDLKFIIVTIWFSRENIIRSEKDHIIHAYLGIHHGLGFGMPSVRLWMLRPRHYQYLLNGPSLTWEILVFWKWMIFLMSRYFESTNNMS